MGKNERDLLKEMDDDSRKSLSAIKKIIKDDAARPIARPTWGVVVCPECGKKFPINDKGRHRRFCSAECREEYYRKQKDRSAWPSARTAVCPQCGKEFTATREQKHKRVYCSHRCAAIAWRKRERAAALRQADGAGVKKEGQDDCDQT